ncbi:MAG: OmpH family outer membrane protein [Gammaproteobacteria bacterium]
MMKKIFIAALSGVALLMSVNPAFAAQDATVQPAQATMAAAPNGMKIGVVDIRQVLQKSPQVASAQKLLRNQFQAREKEFRALQQQVRADADKLNRDASVMKDADRKVLQQKIQEQQQKLQNMQMGLQQDLFTAQNQQMQGIMGKLQNAVNEVAKQGQFTLVLTKDNVAFANQQLDITNQVLDAMTRQK